MTQWTMGNPDRIRERMEEQKDSEQTYWVSVPILPVRNPNLCSS
jgi:hypothetical protein